MDRSFLHSEFVQGSVHMLSLSYALRSSSELDTSAGREAATEIMRDSAGVEVCLLR